MLSGIHSLNVFKSSVVTEKQGGTAGLYSSLNNIFKKRTTMKETLETKIQQVINNLYSIEKEVILEIPPLSEMGDLTTNLAFGLSKQVGKNPREVAESIINELQSDKNILKLSIAGPGFINIYLNKASFVQSALNEIFEKKENYLNLNIGREKNLSIEHTAANPNKHLHIGHLRNISIGDTLVRIMKKANYQVTVQYFLNDQGLQVAKVLWGLMNVDLLLSRGTLKDITVPKALMFNNSAIGNEITEQSSQMKVDTLAGKIYVASEKVISEEPEYEVQTRDIIKDMESGDNAIANYADLVTKKILLGQIETVSKFGVYYDEIITESVMTQSNEVERVIDSLFKTGKLEKKMDGKNKGCIVIKNLDNIGGENPDKILIRSDGTAVYTAKDIVLTLWKFGKMDIQFKFAPLIKQYNNITAFLSTSKDGEARKEDCVLHINVVDQRQSYPLEVVKQALKELGYVEESKNYHHLAYEYVSLSSKTALLLGMKLPELSAKSVAMSGRKGFEMDIDTLLTKMTSEILDKNSMKEDKIDSLEAEQIAASALRYYMIKYSYSTIIIFDINDALRSDGDTGIYLMYAYVRAKNILKKVGDLNMPENIDNSFIDNSIVELMTQISFAKNTLEKVARSFEVNGLASYTYNLAKVFTMFYQNVNVMNEENESKKALYLNIVKSFEIVYSQLLDTLGIYKPDKM